MDNVTLQSQGLNQYANLNPLDQASNFRKKEILYKTAAIITCIAFAAIGISALIWCGMIAPSYVPFLMMAEGAIQNFVQSKIATPLMKKGKEAKEKYRIAKGIVAKIAEMKALNLGETELLNAEQYATLLGRTKYWIDTAIECEEKMTTLEKEKESLIGQLNQKPNPQEKQELQEKFDKVDMKLHYLIEQQYLPAKIQAAYFQHVICQPIESKELENFDTFHPDTYQHRLGIAKDEPYFLSYSVQKLRTAHFENLEQMIFAPPPIAVAV
jgi:hypothetical protein